MHWTSIAASLHLISAMLSEVVPSKKEGKFRVLDSLEPVSVLARFIVVTEQPEWVRTHGLLPRSREDYAERCNAIWASIIHAASIVHAGYYNCRRFGSEGQFQSLLLFLCFL